MDFLILARILKKQENMTCMLDETMYYVQTCVMQFADAKRKFCSVTDRNYLQL